MEVTYFESLIISGMIIHNIKELLEPLKKGIVFKNVPLKLFGPDEDRMRISSIFYLHKFHSPPAEPWDHQILAPMANNWNRIEVVWSAHLPNPTSIPVVEGLRSGVASPQASSFC